MSDKKIIQEVLFDASKETSNDGAIEKLIAQFEDVAHNEEGIDYWFARDLQSLLGYDRWENFLKVIDKAKSSCESTGYKISDHFRDVTKMVLLGSGAERETADIQMTRYACYLVAQNGDSRKKPIAFAQTYFAIQTRKQELLEVLNQWRVVQFASANPCILVANCWNKSKYTATTCFPIAFAVSG